MQTLKYQKFHNLKPYHVHILRANSANIAFCRLHKDEYLVAAKSQDMFELKAKLFPKTNQRHQPDHVHPLMNLQSNDRYHLLNKNLII